MAKSVNIVAAIRKTCRGRTVCMLVASHLVVALFVILLVSSHNSDITLRGSPLHVQMTEKPFLQRALPQIMTELESPLHIFTTKSIPPFIYAAATIDKDTNIAVDAGVLEPVVTKTISNFSHECCARGGHFVDVGANFGWYTTYVASMGCHVHAFEGVPLFASMVNLQRHLNPNISSRVHIYNSAVSFSSGAMVTMNIPRSAQKQRVYGATRASFSSSNSTQDSANEVTILTTTLDDALTPVMALPRTQLCGLKMDIEGFEPYAFLGAKKVLSQLTHIIFEINKNKLCTLPDQASTGCPIICKMIDSLRYEHKFTRMLIINAAMRDSMANTDTKTWNMLAKMSDLIDMPCSAIMTRFTGVKPDENGFVDANLGHQFTINVWMSKI